MIPHGRRVMERMHEGILYQDQHKRYCLYEPDVPEYKRLTCTSGCRLEIWLNRAWIAGHVEGDGEDYWLFADGGGRFLLAERMKARYIERPWRSNMRDISGICSLSPDTKFSHSRTQRLNSKTSRKSIFLENSPVSGTLRKQRLAESSQALILCFRVQACFR